MSKTTPSKGVKHSELQKSPLDYAAITHKQTLKKQPRNGERPIQLHSAGRYGDLKPVTTWICKNLACKAVLSSEDSFCKRCSCCICHLFDDNKDPSLWLVCASETDDKDCCGSSCHVECALEQKKVGCIDIGKTMHLDGSYSCASCGKVSGILGFWKRQLVVARDARRVDILCFRIYLSCRLLEGTSHFKELHQIVEDAKAKLEIEVGPVNGDSAKMARGIVSRLSAGAVVQNLCFSAIEKADEFLNSQLDLEYKDSLPAACKFKFEDITSSTLVVILKETSSVTSDAIKSYKFWYWKSGEQPCNKEPAIVLKDKRRILVFNLEPCTEYSFRVISFTDDGDIGHSESKCFTGSRDLLSNRAKHDLVEGCSSHTQGRGMNQSFKSSGFKIRKVGKFLRQAWADEGYFEGLCGEYEEESCGGSGEELPETGEEVRVLQPVSRRLDLNGFSVPDLNIEVPVPMEASPNANRFGSEKNGLVRSNFSGGSETCAAEHAAEVPAVDSRSEGREQLNKIKRETHLFDEDYEYCVKIVRRLECMGHIEKDFRVKFLTWFSLRATEKDLQVVITFIRTLLEEPSSLAGQLVDSFRETISCKKPRNGVCSKLWN